MQSQPNSGVNPCKRKGDQRAFGTENRSRTKSARQLEPHLAGLQVPTSPYVELFSVSSEPISSPYTNPASHLSSPYPNVLSHLASPNPNGFNDTAHTPFNMLEENLERNEMIYENQSQSTTVTTLSPYPVATTPVAGGVSCRVQSSFRTRCQNPQSLNGLTRNESSSVPNEVPGLSTFERVEVSEQTRISDEEQWSIPLALIEEQRIEKEDMRFLTDADVEKANPKIVDALNAQYSLEELGKKFLQISSTISPETPIKTIQHLTRFLSCIIPAWDNFSETDLFSNANDSASTAIQENVPVPVANTLLHDNVQRKVSNDTRNKPIPTQPVACCSTSRVQSVLWAQNNNSNTCKNIPHPGFVSESTIPPGTKSAVPTSLNFKTPISLPSAPRSRMTFSYAMPSNPTNTTNMYPMSPVDTFNRSHSSSEHAQVTRNEKSIVYDALGSAHSLGSTQTINGLNGLTLNSGVNNQPATLYSTSTDSNSKITVSSRQNSHPSYNYVVANRNPQMTLYATGSQVSSEQGHVSRIQLIPVPVQLQTGNPIQRRQIDNNVRIIVGTTSFTISQTGWTKIYNPTNLRRRVKNIFETLFDDKERLSCTVSGRKSKSGHESLNPVKQQALYACVAFLNKHPGHFPLLPIRADQYILDEKLKTEVNKIMSQNLNYSKQRQGKKWNAQGTQKE